MFIKQEQIEEAEPLFDDREDLLEWMEDNGFMKAKKSVLIRLKEFAQAGEIYESEGNLVEAALLYQKIEDPTYKRRALDLLVKSLWQRMPFAWLERSKNLDTKKETTDLLSKAEALIQYADAVISRYLRIFRYTLNNDIESLVQEANNIPPDDNTSKIYALDRALQRFDKTKAKLGLRRGLLAQEQYLSLAVNLGGSIDLSRAGVQRLFGFEPLEQSQYAVVKLDQCLLFNSSILNELIDGDGNGRRQLARFPIRTVNKGRSIHSTDLLEFIRVFIAGRIYRRLDYHSRITMGLPDLRAPCLYHTIIGACRVAHCGRQHPPKEVKPSELFEARLATLTVQFRIISYFEWLLTSRITLNEISDCQRSIK
jgi:hypothetical protein